MVRSGSLSSAGSEFGNFLYASIDEDDNGMPLSVLSALARMDIDPWAEAATLAQLPQETATRKLASMIAALPDEPTSHRDASKVATRLITLLPRRADPSFAARSVLHAIGTPESFLGL